MAKITHILLAVAEFHRTFEQPILPAPKIPSADRAQLRIDLIREELEEFFDAIQKNDIVEVADALADLQYVLAGAVLEFGLADQFARIFSEVHRSNMSKACLSLAEAEKTVEHYLRKDGTIAYVSKSEDGRFFVRRVSDNKTLKSINYSPADLKSIIE